MTLPIPITANVAVNEPVRTTSGEIGTIVGQVYPDPSDGVLVCLVKIDKGACLVYAVTDLEPVTLEQMWAELQAVPSYIERNLDRSESGQSFSGKEADSLKNGHFQDPCPKAKVRNS